MFNDNCLNSINDNTVLHAPIKRITINIGGNNILYFPETAVILEANDAVIKILDQLSIPCTFASLLRRVKVCGVNPSDKELLSLIRTLAEKNCVKLDGKYRYDINNIEFSIAGKIPELKALAIHTTNKCTLHCKYCYNYNYRHEHETTELTYSQWNKIIDNAVDMGVRDFIITGGEPLLRMDLLPIFINYRSSQTAIFALITNGTLVNDDNITDIARAFSRVTVSIDSHITEKNDYYRGKGSFIAATNAIKLLKEEGIYVNANVVLSNGTIDDFQQTKAYLYTLGCNNVTPMVMQSAESHALQFRPSKTQVEAFVDENYDLLQRECTFEELYGNAKLGWVGYKSSCGTAAAEGAISSDGRLYPCRMLMYDELSAGSVVENKLEDLWQNSSTFRRIREFDYQKIEECSECELFGLCIGGCRAVAYARTGRIDGWIGQDFCHEQKQRFRHKLAIGVLAEKERERKHVQTVDQ